MKRENAVGGRYPRSKGHRVRVTAKDSVQNGGRTGVSILISLCTEVVATWTVGRVIISSCRTLNTWRRDARTTTRAYFLFPTRVHHKTPLESNGARMRQEKPCHNRSVDLLRNGGKKTAGVDCSGKSSSRDRSNGNYLSWPLPLTPSHNK